MRAGAWTEKILVQMPSALENIGLTGSGFADQAPIRGSGKTALAELAVGAGANPENAREIGTAGAWLLAVGIPVTVYIAIIIMLAIPFRRMGLLGGIMVGGVAATVSTFAWYPLTILADIHPMGSGLIVFVIFGVAGALFIVTLFKPGN